jgi:hypothetical protein
LTTRKVVHIKAETAQHILSPAQKKFNNLIKKIDAQKKLLAEWQESLSRCQQDAVEKLEPLKKILHEQQAEMVLFLDAQFTSHKFTRTQAEKLTHLITETCEELITLHQRDDLKPLYNKYSADDFDEMDASSDTMALDMMKAMFEQEFGVSLDEDDIDLKDPRGTAERLAEKAQQQAQAKAEQAASRPQPKKSAKQQAKEAREAEEAANVSKSIQAVYRQLVGALHPDREQDPTERERKTELMQQVTVAYSNKDLLKLLELQLSVEQIDQNKLNNIAADRLKHYNKILSQQAAELQEELLLKEAMTRQMVGVSPFEQLSPKRLVMLFREDLRTTQDMITRIQGDLLVFKKDVKQLKAWLNRYQIPQTFDPFDGAFPFDFR